MINKNKVAVTFPEEFCRWLGCELLNVKEWNMDRPELVWKQDLVGSGFECSLELENVWKVEIKGRHVFFESNVRFFSVKKGLKFNTIQGTIIIS